MDALRRIGYWQSRAEPDWPDPADFIDADWDKRERDIIGTYLRSGESPLAECGESPCRLCGQPNGSAELTDGVLWWPEGLSHYVLDHNVRLPVEVLDLINQRIDATGRSTVDSSDPTLREAVDHFDESIEAMHRVQEDPSVREVLSTINERREPMGRAAVARNDPSVRRATDLINERMEAMGFAPMDGEWWREITAR